MKKRLGVALLASIAVMNVQLCAGATDVSTYNELVQAINDVNVSEINITNTGTISTSAGSVGDAINRSITITGSNTVLDGGKVNGNIGLNFGGSATGQTYNISNLSLNNFSDRSNYGAAIKMRYGTLNIDNVTFSGNSTRNGGGAIYIQNNNAYVTVKDSTFTNNNVTNSANGGAIWNRANLTIIADQSDVNFTGNKVQNNVAQDIKNESVLNLNAGEGKSINFNDGGIANTGTININSSDKAEQTTGSVYLNGYINGGTVNLYDGTLKMGENGNLSGATLVARGGAVDFQDGQITSSANLGNVDTSNTSLNVLIDAKLNGGTGTNDTWASTVSGSNGVIISSINLLSDDGQGGTLNLSSGVADGYTITGQSVNYLITSPTETSLTFTAGGLPAAVQNTTSTRTYSMVGDETITAVAGTVGGVSGTATNLTINANNHTINGNNLEGITMQTSGNAGYVSNVNINDATITGFKSNGGGVVFQRQGDLNVNNTTFDGNTAVQLGGAVRVQNGAATFTDTNFTNNTVTNYTNAGGAIAIQNGTVNIVSDTKGVLFEGNTSKGVSNAINIAGGTLNLKAGNSDIVFNDAITSSGGTINIQSAYGNTNGTGKVINNSTIQASALNISGGELQTNISDITVTNNQIGLSGNGILTLKDSEINLTDMPALTGSGGYLGLEGKATIDTANFVGKNRGLILDGAEVNLNKNGVNYTNMQFSSVNVSDNGATLNMADSSTATYDLGDLTLNGDLLVSLDAKFGSNSVDKISATSVTGDGNIIITCIRNQSDADASHHQTQIGFGAAMSIIQLADDFTLELASPDLKPKEDYYTISYNNTNGILKYVLSEDMSLKMVVDDTDTTRIYNMGKDEEVNQNLSWMAGAEGSKMTINGHGYDVNGNVTPTGGVADEHIAVREGQTVVVNNVGSGDSTTDGWNNFQSQKGGALLFYGDGEINNSTFTNNSSVSKDDPTVLYETGGAIAVAGSNVTIKDSYFGNNSAERGGAVAVIYEDEVAGNLYVENTTFTGNHASHIGGALYNNDDANTVIVDSVFTNNSADNSGGAIFNRNDSTINLIAKDKDFIIAGNTSGDSSNGIDNNGVLNLNSSADKNVIITDAITMDFGSAVGEINVNKELSYTDKQGETQTAPTAGITEFHNDVKANNINVETGTLNIASDNNSVTVDSSVTAKEGALLNLNAGDDSLTVSKEINADTINVNSSVEISKVAVDSNTGSATVTKANAPTNGTVAFEDNVTATKLNVQGSGKLTTAKDTDVTINEFNIAKNASVEQNANATVSGGKNEGKIAGTDGNLVFDGNYENASSGSIAQKTVTINEDKTFTNKGTLGDNESTVNNKGTINNTGKMDGTINNSQGATINTAISSLKGNINNDGDIHYTTSGKTSTDIKGNGTVHLDSNGTTVLNNKLNGNTLSLNNGTLVFGSNKDISDGGIIFNGGNVDGILDGKLTTYKLGNANVVKDSKIKGIDFKLNDLTSDKFIGNYSGSAKINIDKVQVQGTTKKDYIKIHLSDTTKIAKNNLNVKNQKLPSVLTPIRWLKGRVEDNYLIYEGQGNAYNTFNPSVTAASVAAHVGGMNAQTEAFHHGFYHMNRYTKYSVADRICAQNYNKVALSEGAINPEIENPLTESAIWSKPYTSWESVHLKHGPHVNSFAYGSYFGGDTDLVDIGGGFKGVLSAFIGYNGNHMSYDNVSMNMEGATVGLTGTAYKGKFFTGITVSTGASAVQAYTPYGTDNFGMLNAGIANKTGYNFEINGGKVIIQPSVLVGYTFVNTFDYTNAAGIRIKSDPLNAVQIMPELKVIGNTKNGWQPYATVGMAYNIFAGNHTVMANETKLPQFTNRAYVQYGVGIQRSWSDKFTAFAETLLRNGGRNGVVLFGGFRWLVGKDNSNNTKVYTNKTNISKAQKPVKQSAKTVTKPSAKTSTTDSAKNTTKTSANATVETLAMPTVNTAAKTSARTVIKQLNSSHI